MLPPRRTRAAALLCLAGALLSAGALAGAEAFPRSQAGVAAGVATFAGGCFWCVEQAFDEVGGVLATTSGYMGGQTVDPTYEQVSSGTTGHLESVQVKYDPRRVTYERLLEAFWRNIDPLDGGGQFCDRGPQYRAAIFVHDGEQRQLAEASKERLRRSGRFDRPIATEVRDAAPFYAAEAYHQDYYRKNPVRYKFYKYSCGRAQRLEELWGRPK
jgi:peptide-methionine (S)-S-oxide reductase